MFNALGARDVEEGAIMPIVGSLSCNTGPNGHDAGNFACNQAVNSGHVLPVNIYGGNKRPDRPEGGFYVRMDEATSKTLDAASGLNPTCSQGGTAVMQLMAVRRLTPVECERLQGFPDNYTAIPWRGKEETPDGPRYKALGNSMAVPVMKWIGEKIQRRAA
jgi:site-specific DNA-cytosine methylase